MGGLVPEQYVGQHFKRLQNLTFSSVPTGLSGLRELQFDRVVSDMLWRRLLLVPQAGTSSSSSLGGLRLPLLLHVGETMHIHDLGRLRRLRIWLELFPRSAPNQQFQLAPSEC